MESWYTGTETPPRHCEATCAQYRRGRLSPMTESRSPRLKPSAASPSAKSRTWSPYSRHVDVCQMPRSFSRIAGRSGMVPTFFSSRRGSVWSGASERFSAMDLRDSLGLAEVGLDDLGIRAHLVGRALGDLQAHVEHG